MSSGHDAHGGNASAHAHDDHPFDGEPATELSPGEPRSPAWLPAVGLAFFSCVAVYMLAGGDPAPAVEPAMQPPAPAAEAPAAAPQPQPAQPQGAQQAPGQIRQLSPQQVEELRKRMEEARKNQGQAQPGH